MLYVMNKPQWTSAVSVHHFSIVVCTALQLYNKLANHANQCRDICPLIMIKSTYLDSG